MALACARHCVSSRRVRRGVLSVECASSAECARASISAVVVERPSGEASFASVVITAGAGCIVGSVEMEIGDMNGVFGLLSDWLLCVAGTGESAASAARTSSDGLERSASDGMAGGSAMCGREEADE